MLFRAAETPQFEEIKIASPLFMQIAGSLSQLHKRDSPLAIMNRPKPRTSPPKFVTYLFAYPQISGNGYHTSGSSLTSQIR